MSARTLKGFLDVDAGVLASLCQEHRPHILSGLPFQAAEIADAIGFEGLFKICEQWGGRILTLPHESQLGTRDTVLAECVGKKQAAELIHRLGHGPVTISTVGSIAATLRPYIIAHFRREGVGVHEITERLGVHRTTVYRDIGVMRELGISVEPVGADA